MTTTELNKYELDSESQLAQTCQWKYVLYTYKCITDTIENLQKSSLLYENLNLNEVESKPVGDASARATADAGTHGHTHAQTDGQHR